MQKGWLRKEAKRSSGLEGKSEFLQSSSSTFPVTARAFYIPVSPLFYVFPQIHLRIKNSSSQHNLFATQHLQFLNTTSCFSQDLNSRPHQHTKTLLVSPSKTSTSTSIDYPRTAISRQPQPQPCPTLPKIFSSSSQLLRPAP